MKLSYAIEHQAKCLAARFSKKAKENIQSLRAGASPIQANRKLCLFDFTSGDIDSVMARYLFHIVTEFQSLGFQLVFVNRFTFLATAHRKQFKNYCFANDYALIEPDQTDTYFDVVITDRKKHPYRSSSKFIRVSYTERRAEQEHEIELPFFVHPNTQKNNSILQQPYEPEKDRLLKIFFAGNCNAIGYNKPFLSTKFSKIPRYQAIEQLKQQFPDVVHHPQSHEDLYSCDANQKITLVIPHHSGISSIPAKKWIETLSQSDFFLAFPGINMPLCHNVIESLAAGAIPIIQYAEYLSPPLTHGVNCLIFSCKETLIQQVNTALQMDSDEILRMRKEAYSYYQNHCEPGQFAQKLIGSAHEQLTLLFCAYRTPPIKPPQ